MAGATGTVGKRGVTIEEVFTTLSKWAAHNGPPVVPRVALTPRSAAACLREGVDPQVTDSLLVIRSHPAPYADPAPLTI